MQHSMSVWVKRVFCTTHADHQGFQLIQNSRDASACTLEKDRLLTTTYCLLGGGMQSPRSPKLATIGKFQPLRSCVDLSSLMEIAR